jgi:hypothetical protein
MKNNRLLSLACLALLAGGAALADTPQTPPSTPISPVPPGAALRAATVKVTVAPDHRDWTYQVGETAHFSVAVTADSEPIDGVTVAYTVGPDMYPGEAKTVAVPLTGLVIDAGTMTTPGFLRCIVTTQVAGHKYRGLATAAFAPNQIKPTQVEPPDFDAFWDAGKAELGKVPVDARMTLMPDACTSKVDVYHVSFRRASAPWAPRGARRPRASTASCASRRRPAATPRC